MMLYAVSFLIIGRYKTRSDHDDLYGGDVEEDYVVYRIAYVLTVEIIQMSICSVWLCTFSLSVSIGAALLLPVSIIGHLLQTHFTNNKYLQWLTHSLIYSSLHCHLYVYEICTFTDLWDYIFLLSNCCMYVLLPFAYFFIESQGFSFVRKVSVPLFTD